MDYDNGPRHEIVKENTFFRGEVEDLKVFLNAETQTLSHNFKTCTKGCSLQENFDTQVHTI